MFLKHKRTWRTGSRVLPGVSAACVHVGKQLVLWVELWILWDGVQFRAFVCA